MRLVRLILVCLLSVTTLVSLASAYPAMAGTDTGSDAQSAEGAGGCCKKESETPGNGCSGHCMMQCCRAIPMTPKAAPALEEYGPVIESGVQVPTALRSLADPEAIFHPPKR